MYWLFKEEPDHYSFDDLVRDGKTDWDGVRNNLALIHLRKVKKGDEVFFYHTGDEKSVVGVMRAESDAFSQNDDTVADPSKSKAVAVTVRPVRRLNRPVTLREIKSNPKFKDFALVKIARLSVMPVTKEQWEEILKLSTK